jgi:endonuclease/exonuclease/phosphatase family metal-dependent hydrolase
LKNIILLSLLILVLAACGTNHNLTNTPVNQTNVFGTDSTFEVVTWNLKTFPVDDQKTVNMLIPLIQEMNVDLIAVQEISDVAAFNQLTSRLPGYASVTMITSNYESSGYLYKTNSISIQENYLIYYDHSYSSPFPRAPYVIECSWKGHPLIVVNNHLKAYGDNVIDSTNTDDEEYRRLVASELLDTYIQEHWANQSVIVVGDMNDAIEDPQVSNVFWPFISQPDKYSFADMPLALSHTYANASYPSSSSNLDHILINSTLFGKYAQTSTQVKAINIETSVGGGLPQYSLYISDHRPVGLKMDLR